MNDSSVFVDLKVQRNDFEALLEDRRKDKKFTDVQLQIRDKLFDAHRVVLSLYSPVLEAAISEHWSTTKICSISDEYVDVDIVEDLLSFLYTGSIKLTPDNVYSVCVAAHFLQISTLLEHSVKHLYQLITVENLLPLFQFSTTCELEHLNYSCLRFVNNNHEKVFKSSEVLEFPAENFKDLIVGLKKFWAKMLRVNTFHCIIRWTEKNPSQRLTDLPILLDSIPLEELPFEFLTETVSNHPLVKDSMSSIETVSTALANHQTYSRPQENQNLIVIEDMVYVNDDNERTEKTKFMSCYDSHAREWRKLPNMPSDRDDFCVTVVNHQDIVVCGGFFWDHGETPLSVLMFEWSKQSWTELSEMPFGLTSPSIVSFNGCLYVTGIRDGLDDDMNEIYAVLCYSFETQEWKSIAPLNKPRNAKLVEYKNTLYAIGGDKKTTVEKYAPAANQWTMMTTLPNPLTSLAPTLHRNKIYVQNYSGFDVYDPEVNAWTSIAAPVEKLSTKLVSMNDKLLMVNGTLTDESDTPDWVYEFDFSTQKFVEFAEWTPALSICHAVVGAFY